MSFLGGKQVDGKDYTPHFVAAYVALGLALLAVAAIFVIVLLNPPHRAVKEADLGEPDYIAIAKEYVTEAANSNGLNVDKLTVRSSEKDGDLAVVRLTLDTNGPDGIKLVVKLRKGLWAAQSLEEEVAPGGGAGTPPSTG